MTVSLISEMNGANFNSKFFDAGKDQKYIKKGDIFVCLGESGKEHAKYFKRIGHEIEIINIEQM